MLHHVEIDDPSRFSVVLDASRLSPDRVVETLLSAAGVER
jgi:cytidylate kinase